jgi:prevent-host-death family protein
MRMNTIRISATAARNNFFDLLNQVATGVSVIIEKDNKSVAQVIPMVKTNERYKGLTKSLKKAAKGFVYSKNDNPLRRADAMRFLEKLD